MAQNKKKKKEQQERLRRRILKRRMKKNKKGWDPEKDPLPKEVLEEWQKAKIAEETRKRLGIPRPIISAQSKGKRHVAVGSRMFRGDWKTFPDFLFEYIRTILGSDWGNAELRKDHEEMHPIIQWYVKTCKFQKKQKPGKDGIYNCIPNGPFAAYLLLAYDLYIVGHNHTIQEKLIRRLKNKDQFQGARYELFAAATCIKAGLALEFEDESDISKTHVEFVGTHRPTGQMVCVEAKSKHRKGILGYRSGMQDEQARLRIRRLLNSALMKEHRHPLVVFLDLNIPPDQAENVFGMPLTDSMKEISHSIRKTSNGKDIFNLLVLTNHPHHYGESDKPDPRRDRAAMVSINPQIIPKYLKALTDIYDAAETYGSVPQNFPENKAIKSSI